LLPGDKGKRSQLQFSRDKTIFWCRETFLWRRAISQVWGGCTTVSLLDILDFQSISLCFVFVFFCLVVYFQYYLYFSYTQQSIKISVALLAMGHERFSHLLTKSTNVNVTTSNFKQLYGESLKDAWFRLTKFIVRTQTPCKKEKLHLYFYYGLVPWYKNALDFALRGSFMLSLPEQKLIIIKNLFGNNIEKKVRIGRYEYYSCFY
jgi:hypothetical protein